MRFYLLLALFATSSAFSQIPWPGITGFAVTSQGHLIVSCEDRTTLFSSVDNGVSWHELFVPGGGVFDLHVAPNDMLFGISDDGNYIVRSSDEGETWYTAHGVGVDTLFYNLIVTARGTVLASDPLSGCLLRSTDDGRKWKQAQTNVSGALFTGLDLLGADSSGTLYAGSLAGDLSTSTDDGATWHTTGIHAPLDDWFDQICTTPNGTVYLATPHAGIYRRTPGDTTLTLVTAGLPAGQHLPPVATPSGTLLTAPVDYINTEFHSAYRSTDGGGTWSRVHLGMTDTAVEAIAALNSHGVFAGSKNGLMFRSMDDGRTWSQLSNTVAAPNTFDPAEVVAIARNTDCNYFAATWGNGVFRSTDTAKTWTRVNTGLTDTLAWTIDVTPANDLYLGTVTGAFRSVDNGDHWTAINNGFEYGGHEGDSLVTAFLAGTGSSIFAATGHGVYRSIDNGSHWTTRYFPPSDPRFRAIITYALERDDAGRLYAGGVGGFIARAANEGATWETLVKLDSGSSNVYAVRNVIALYAHGSALLAGTDAGLFRSIDDGGTWTRVGGELDTAFVFSFLPPQPDGIFAQTSFGVYRSVNNGGTWTFDSLHTYLGFQNFVSSAFDSASCAIGAIGPPSNGQAQLLHHETPKTGVRQDAGALSTPTITVSPNPFNTQTSLSYPLANDAQVDIEVCTMLGVAIGSLAHGHQSMGTHVVTWLPGELPAGVYFCRMRIAAAGAVPRTLTTRLNLVR